MKSDWRENRRWHLFKSATGKFVLVDDKSKDWKLYEKTLSSFCLKILALGVIKHDAWIDIFDFTKEEKAKIEENMV